jgi:hypothetical protein
MPVSASSSQAALTAKNRDGNRPKPVSFAGADAAFDAGAVVGLQVPDRAFAEWSLGGHDLVAQALDGVEQPQLGAGMRLSPAHDEPDSGRVAADASCRTRNS